jgi:asparagine N-glycosylation enzyme membrane subunit Stt3
VAGLTFSTATLVHQLLDAAMKTSRKLGLAAVVVFVISHFLPAYGDSSGIACFGVCWNILLGHDTEILSGGWFYYSGFAISSIIFLVLVVALFVTKKSRKLRSVVSVVFFLHVLSWPVLHIFPPDLTEIKIGYYVWLAAYGLLVAAHLCKEHANHLNQFPLRVQSYDP